MPPFLTPELQVLLWSLFVFFTLLALLWKFAWGPIMHALEEREHKIQKTIDDANAQFKAAQDKMAEYQRKIEQAKDDAAAIIAEGKRGVEKLSAENIAEANKESSRLIERARREIELAKQAAVEQLRQGVVSLTAEVTAKVLQREINADDHRRFVQEAIEQIGKS
ncbi:MAG: F0F1 ATP synthase subunit B [Planctomycetota bacterium]